MNTEHLAKFFQDQWDLSDPYQTLTLVNTLNSVNVKHLLNQTVCQQVPVTVIC